MGNAGRENLFPYAKLCYRPERSSQANVRRELHVVKREHLTTSFGVHFQTVSMQRLLATSALFLSIATLGCATALGQTTNPPRGDVQAWTEVQLAVPLAPRVDLVLMGVTRFGRDVSRPVNERIGGGVSFRVGKYLTLLPFYLHVALQPTKDNHSTEERINLEATVKVPAGRFTISDRNRIEFHIHRPPPNFTQYRNRLQIEHPLELGKAKFIGFVADEVFYDSIAAAWIRNRVFLGITRKVNKHFTLDLYYVRQNDSHSQPGDIHAVGTTLKFHL
jgi:Protein of unknown function (DUF2490)